MRENYNFSRNGQVIKSDKLDYSKLYDNDDNYDKKHFVRDGKVIKAKEIDYSKLKLDPDLTSHDSKFKFSNSDEVKTLKKIDINKLEALKSRLDLAYNSVIIAINKYNNYNNYNVDIVREDLIGLHKMIATVIGGEISVNPIIPNSSSDISDDDQKLSLTDEETTEIYNELTKALDNNSLQNKLCKALYEVKDEFDNTFNKRMSLAERHELKSRFLGKNSFILKVLYELDKLNPDSRKIVGDKANEVTTHIRLSLTQHNEILNNLIDDLKNNKVPEQDLLNGVSDEHLKNINSNDDKFGDDESGLGPSPFDETITEEDVKKARKVFVKDSLKKTKLFLNKNLIKFGLNELANDVSDVIKSVEETVEKKL